MQMPCTEKRGQHARHYCCSVIGQEKRRDHPYICEELWCFSYPTEETYPEDCMPSLRDISGQFGPWSSPVYVVVGNSCDTSMLLIYLRSMDLNYKEFYSLKGSWLPAAGVRAQRELIDCWLPQHGEDTTKQGKYGLVKTMYVHACVFLESPC